MKFGVLTVLAIAVVSAVLGASATMLSTRGSGSHTHPGLHELIHENLGLTEAEEARLAPLEDAYHRRQAELEDRIRQSNRDLAQAIANAHPRGMTATEATNATKTALAELQELTVSHVLAMRDAIDPSHHEAFDAAVASSLSGHGH